MFRGADVVDALLLGLVLALVVVQVAGQFPGKESADQKERRQDEQNHVQEGPGIVRRPADGPLGPVAQAVHAAGGSAGMRWSAVGGRIRWTGEWLLQSS